MAKTTRYKSESTLTVESERFSGLSIELYNKLNEQGHPIYIVRHTDLVAAIDSQEVRANGCRYEFGPIQIIGDMHYLVECVIRDGNGNFEIREHGEVMQDTLLTEISKQYPAKMCLNRAFDRAAIRYLGLGKRVYSSEEIEPSTLKDNVTVESTQNAHEAAGRQVAEEQKTSKKEPAVGFANVNSEEDLKKEENTREMKIVEPKQELPFSEEPVAAKEPDVKAEKKAEKPAESGKKKCSKEEIREAAIRIGCMKLGFMNGYQNKTVKEVADSEPKKLVWVAENVYSGKNLDMANNVRFYLKCRNIGYKVK